MSIDNQPTNDESQENQRPDSDTENQIAFDFFSMQEQAMEDGEELLEAQQEVKTAVLNLGFRRKKSNELIDECYEEEDLVKRAKKIALLEGFKFPHIKAGNPKDPTDIGGKAITASDANRMVAMDVLFDGGSGRVPFPHIDTFGGRMVDHRGEQFGKHNLRIREILDAVDASGLTNPSAKAVGDTYRDWAQEHRVNDLHVFFESKMRPWDGESRLECLLDLFKCEDTPLNRKFSRYFWLSLYNRIVNPGSNVPISMALIGGQDAGKSFFSLQLCWYLMGDKGAKPIGLDFSERNYGNFLRKITGKSIVANVGEMTGFKKADINRVKDFTTQSGDEFDFKFEDAFIKRRQWITIMDGNTYDGLQRDDTGNRRFYPIFVGQVPDENGQPTWYRKPGTTVAEERFSVDYTGFEDKLWNIMAECRDWFEKHGQDGYALMVKETSDAVSDFSIEEMKSARGTIRDESIEDYLKAVLICIPRRHNNKPNAKYKGVLITTGVVKQVMRVVFRHETWDRTVKNYMLAMGFIQTKPGEWWMEYRDGVVPADETIGNDDYEGMVIAGRSAFIRGDYDKDEVVSIIDDYRASYGVSIRKSLGIDLDGF